MTMPGAARVRADPLVGRMAVVSARRGFVTGGCWCVDRNRTLEFWPEEDMSVPTAGLEVRGGGSACNFAIDMRKLDPAMPVETIGLVGADQEGRFLRAEAERHGIGHAQLAVTEEARTHATDAYSSRRSGRRTHIFDEGASALLTPDHFDFGMTQGRFLHLGLPGVHRRMDAPWGADPNGWVTVLRAAQAAGMFTNLELATVALDRIGVLAKPCLVHLDYLVVNDAEIGAIAGRATVRSGSTDESACLDAARSVLEQGSMACVVVHFTMGAVAVARDGTDLRQPSVAVPAQAFVGANGAGDAFAAGFFHAIHEGASLGDALKRAHASAAACLRSLSTSDSVEGWRACLDLAQKWGWRDLAPLRH